MKAFFTETCCSNISTICMYLMSGIGRYNKKKLIQMYVMNDFNIKNNLAQSMEHLSNE